MKLLRVSAFLLIFMTSAALASAQTADDPPRGNVGIFGVFTASASDGVDNGHGGGASATFFFTPILGVEGSFRRQSFDISPTDENVLSGGSMDANIISANVVVRAPSGNIQPYFSAGVAFFDNSYELDQTRTAGLAQFNFVAAETVDSSVGFNVGGGADFRATPSIGFFVEGRYTIATADTTGGLTDQITQISATEPGEQKLNIFTVGGGIRIFF